MHVITPDKASSATPHIRFSLDGVEKFDEILTEWCMNGTLVRINHGPEVKLKYIDHAMPIVPKLVYCHFGEDDTWDYDGPDGSISLADIYEIEYV